MGVTRVLGILKHKRNGNILRAWNLLKEHRGIGVDRLNSKAMHDYHTLLYFTSNHAVFFPVYQRHHLSNATPSPYQGLTIRYDARITV